MKMKLPRVWTWLAQTVPSASGPVSASTAHVNQLQRPVYEFDEYEMRMRRVQLQKRTLSKFVGTILPLEWIHNEHEMRSANSALTMWLVGKQLMLT